MAADQSIVYAAAADYDDGQGRDVELYPGVNAVDAVTGELLWHTAADNVCAGRAGCQPGVSAPISAFPGFVLAGHADGRLRAYAKDTGEVLWEFDTAREFDSISGEQAKGGTISGGGGPVAYGNMLYVNSGYAMSAQMPGNVLLAFELAE